MAETSRWILKVIFYDTTPKRRCWLILIQTPLKECQGEHFFGVGSNQGFSKKFLNLLRQLFNHVEEDKSLHIYSCEICPESVDYTHLLVHIGDEGGQLYEKIAQVI